jgi:hypothetical protein
MHFQVVLSAIFIAAMLEEEDAAGAPLSVPESLLLSLTMGSSATRRIWSVSSAMEWEVGAVQEAVKD